MVRATAFAAINKTSAAWGTPEMASMLFSLVQREDAVLVRVLRESGGKMAAGDVYGEGYAEYAAAVLDECLRSCDREVLLSELFTESAAGSPVRSSTLDLLGLLYERGTFSPEQMTRTFQVLVSGVSDSTSFMIRSSALGALGAAFRSGVGVSSHEREQMHRAALAALADPIAAVRVAPIHRIQELGQGSDLVVLRHIANEDTARTLLRGHTSFPVREAANAAIAVITQRVKE